MKAPETVFDQHSAAASRPIVRAAALVLLVCLSAADLPAVELASPEAVQGEQWALYDVSSIRGEPYCLPYQNSGYSLSIQSADAVSRRIMVRCGTEILDCRAAFPLDGSSIPPEAAVYASPAASCAELSKLSLNLTSACRTEYQAVNRILCWVSGAIEYRSGDEVPDQPLEVLRQGNANCVGAAELSVALLRAAGIPARGVRGFLASGSAAPALSRSFRTRELSLGQEGLHRWIEIYYPGVGWVFSDPFRSVNYVTARYLVFDLEVPPVRGNHPAVFLAMRPELSDSVSTFIRLLELGGMIIPTDVVPSLLAREGLTVRRNGTVQYMPVYIGQVVIRNNSGIPPPDEVRLVPARGSEALGRRVAALRQGVFSFTGLAQGEYRLLFYSGGDCVAERRARVHFPPRCLGTVRIDLGH
jgi:hypothetical protein